MDLAHCRNRNDFKVLVWVHVAHGYQGAVFKRQGRIAVGSGVNPRLITALSNNVAQGGVASVLVGHIFDEVRQFIAGVYPLKVWGVIDVVTRINQPVCVKHHNSIHAQLTTAPRNFMMPCDGGVTTSLMRPIHFRQVHRGHVGYFCSEGDTTHKPSSLIMVS